MHFQQRQNDQIPQHIKTNSVGTTLDCFNDKIKDRQYQYQRIKLEKASNLREIQLYANFIWTNNNIYILSNQASNEIIYSIKSKNTIVGDDVKIVDFLTELKDRSLEIEKEYLKKIDCKNYYSIYYGIRSVILVLEKIIERYHTKNEDKSQIRNDTLKVFPIIRDIIQEVEHYKTNDDFTKHILEKTDQLDDMAYDVNLLKTDKEYIKDVDEKAILKLLDGISYHYRCKGKNMSGDQVVIKILPSSQQQKISQEEISMLREFYSLHQLIKEHKKKWLTVDTFERVNFGVAINVAGSILDNIVVNIKNTHFSIKRTCNVIKLVVLVKQENQTLQKPEFFTQVFPKLTKLIKNILDITEDTSITEERKNRALNSMMDLIDFAHEMDLEDIRKFKPTTGQDEVKHKVDKITHQPHTFNKQSTDVPKTNTDALNELINMLPLPICPTKSTRSPHH